MPKPSMALNGHVVSNGFWTALSAFFTGHLGAVAGELPSLAQQKVPPSTTPCTKCSMVSYLLSLQQSL